MPRIPAPTTGPTFPVDSTGSVGPTAMGGNNPFGDDSIPDPQTGIYNVANRMKELYSPDTRAEDRLNEMLDSYPVRSNPSMLRKIAAGLVNWRRGPEQAQQVIDNAGGFGDKLADWKNRIGPVSSAANIERGANANERTMAYQTIAQELRQQAQDAKEANDSKKLDIAQQRANVYEFKANHPGVKLQFPKGGNIMALDPVSGKLTDTGIPTGTLSELDKLNLGHDNKMEEIHAGGEETRDTTRVRGEEERKNIVVRGQESRTTKATPSASKTATGDKPELPTQTRVRQFNNARELWNSRPDLRPFIKVGNPGSNDFSVTPPGVNYFNRPTGPSKEQYDEIQKAIYGAKPTTTTPARVGGPGPTGGGKPAAKPQRLVKTQRNTQTGETRQVMSLDGGKTWQPVNSQK